MQRNLSGRSSPRSGTGENCGIHPVSGICNHDIQHPTTSDPCFGTILAFVSNHPRRVRLPLVTGARKHGKRQEKACLGEKFSRILACCLFGSEHPGRLGDVSPGASALTDQRITRRQDLALAVLQQVGQAHSFDAAPQSRFAVAEQAGVIPLLRSSFADARNHAPSRGIAQRGLHQ